MSFKAKFDGGKCANCNSEIFQGDLVEYRNEILQHAEGSCFSEVEFELPHGKASQEVSWDVSGDAIDRLALRGLEEAQIAPIGPQGVCPRCRVEFPKSRVCGYCS